MIRLLADRGEMAILLVEQYYDDARELADAYLMIQRGEVLVVLLCGGDKSTQAGDIERAKRLARELDGEADG